MQYITAGSDLAKKNFKSYILLKQKEGIEIVNINNETLHTLDKEKEV